MQGSWLCVLVLYWEKASLRILVLSLEEDVGCAGSPQMPQVLRSKVRFCSGGSVGWPGQGAGAPHRGQGLAQQAAPSTTRDTPGGADTAVSQDPPGSTYPILLFFKNITKNLIKYKWKVQWLSVFLLLWSGHSHPFVILMFRCLFKLMCSTSAVIKIT